VWPFSQNNAEHDSARPTTIDVREAFARSKAGALLIDVRSEQEFAAAHPKGARNVPPARIAAGNAGLAPGDEVLVICLSGHRSLTQARKLAHMGYTNVANVAGGLRAWQQAGLPVKGR
jgi:sulfur-carrier protein adenylyltransferase/sulfurtransferase